MNESEIFAELRAGTTLVTANKRLAREMRQQFNDDQQHQGEQVWDTADILSFEAWVYRLWSGIRNDYKNVGSTHIKREEGAAQSHWIVLNVLQSKALWTHIIAADINQHHHNSEPLWNIAATVRTAMEAWRISRQWHITIAECAKSPLDDYRNFARWADLFIRYCQRNHWIDADQLIDVVMDGCADASTLTDGASLIWMGFDGFNTQQKCFMEMLQQGHVRLTVAVANDNTDVEQQSFEYANESEQWLAAAHWVKDKLQSKPHQNQRLAVVVPNLQSARDAIDHALTQVLSPHHLLDTGSSRIKPFHISLGLKLIDTPVVESALLLLSLTSTANLTSSTISSVILTPFIGGADSECYARNQLEFWSRQRLPYELSLSRFLGWLKQKYKEGQPATPIFLEKINANNALMASLKVKHSFSHWAEFFLSWLDNLGWPGERELNSAQYQTVEAFRREVVVLRSLDMVVQETAGGAVTVATALAVLRQRLSEQPFEPESHRVSVDVLGIMETSGIQFDAIWFGGLTEKAWPPALQASPFIPHELQQQAGYHRASVSLNADYAKKQQNRLRTQCNEIILSRYCSERGVDLLASAFFEPSTATEPQPAPSGLMKQLQENNPPKLERFIDTQGTQSEDKTATSRGGSAVIRDQAACAFRAYARHRLGARDSEHQQPGLDAMQRGNLVHSILQGIWQKIQSSSALLALSDSALERIIDEHISQCSPPFVHKSSGKGFIRAQEQWLKQLLLEWFAMEKNQAQAGVVFRIIECEKKQSLTLGKLTLNFKIDRIDALGDKTLRLIDYKTGTIGTVTSWFGDRPKEPQLPLYALAQHANTKRQNNDTAPLSELQFGQVRAGQCEYVGIHEHNLLQTVKRVTRQLPPEESGLFAQLDSSSCWNAFIEYWNRQLTTLANQYYAGHAEVNPLDNATCDHCDLHGLCRIDELRLVTHDHSRATLDKDDLTQDD